MRSIFKDRAEEMGLITNKQRGLYFYTDKYSDVIYRDLFTSKALDHETVHDTDNINIPLLAIFTKLPTETTFQYAGCISDLYRFYGNDVLNQNVRDSISSIGEAILEERPILWNSHCRMRNEIIIRNPLTVTYSGNVYPAIVVNNSYNGTRAAALSFGISIDNIGTQTGRSTFNFKLGEMRQVHLANANAKLTSAVSTYLNVFSESIISLITDSFNSKLSSKDMMAVLDVIEDIGKNRREHISKILGEISGGGSTSAWHIFLAITRYSSLEQNLNIKRLLENVAESVLIIPAKMQNVLEKI